MSVYVDTVRLKFGRMKMCHMLADDLDELHTMADALGLKREWFQGVGTPHYDICQSKRAKAIEIGAIEASREKVVEIIRTWRERRGKK
jgi:hypothetical protein